MKRNGNHIFYRCSACNHLHLGYVSICAKCHSPNIMKETYDEIPLDQFEMFSDEEKVIGGTGTCSFCNKSSRDHGIDYYCIEHESGSSNGHIYCPEHYLMMKWLMITYGLALHDAEVSLAKFERRKI